MKRIRINLVLIHTLSRNENSCAKERIHSPWLWFACIAFLLCCAMCCMDRAMRITFLAWICRIPKMWSIDKNRRKSAFFFSQQPTSSFNATNFAWYKKKEAISMLFHQRKIREKKTVIVTYFISSTEQKSFWIPSKPSDVFIFFPQKFLPRINSLEFILTRWIIRLTCGFLSTLPKTHNDTIRCNKKVFASVIFSTPG